MKIRPMGAELFHADGWTDRLTGKANLIVVIRKFLRLRLKIKKIQGLLWNYDRRSK